MFLNHCHTFPHGAFPNAPELGTLPELDAFLESEGIERAVAFGPFWGPKTREILNGEDPNAWLLRHLPGHPRLAGAVVANPTAPDACETLETYVRAGFVGVKTHPPVMRFRIDDPAADPFYNLAAQLGVFVLFHTGVHGWRLDEYRPLRIDNILDRHPGLRVIIEHMGVPSPDGVCAGFFDEALSVVNNRGSEWGRNSAVAYVGMTGFARPQHRERVRAAIQDAGAGRCVFGLDWPHMEGNSAKSAQFAAERAVIDSLGLSREQRDAIFGGTLQALVDGVKRP